MRQVSATARSNRAIPRAKTRRLRQAAFTRLAPNKGRRASGAKHALTAQQSASITFLVVGFLVLGLTTSLAEQIGMFILGVMVGVTAAMIYVLPRFPGSMK